MVSEVLMSYLTVYERIDQIFNGLVTTVLKCEYGLSVGKKW